MMNKDLQEWDRRYVWHPFTQMQEWLALEQVIIERAQGAYLFDTQGQKYFDGVSSLWVTVHGHNHPHITKAVIDQVQKLDHSTLLGLGNVPSIELAKRLIDIAPQGLAKVFYSDSGSTAVEIALKMAFQFWQQRKPDAAVAQPRRKQKFITLDQAYHGDTVGSVSVGGIDLFHQLYRPLLFETFKVPTPQSDPNAEKAIEMLRAHAQDTAAFILEPLMQGAAGMLKAPPGYLKKIREACTANNVLLIADEVATGFGRTGRMFACDHEQVTPDFLCLAKGISGGYLPLAATLTTLEIYNGFLGQQTDLKTFFHGHTYTGNPIACAAALASLDLFEEKNFWETLQAKIRFFEKQLERFENVRQVGLMVGIEIKSSEQVGHRICRAARPHGLLIRPLGNVIVLMPPLCSTNEELAQMVETVERCVQEVMTA